MELAQKGKAKSNIIDAALELFYFQGFKGTTVRQIAERAEVNVALISYYFGGKKGLLEELMVQFYEGYFQTAEAVEQMIITPQATVQDRLMHVIQAIFDYLCKEYKMTRFIYRELTLDSMLVREVMTIYLSKEKYFFRAFMERYLEQEGASDQEIDILVLQLLQLLYMPFLQPQVIQEVYYMNPNSAEFKQIYLEQFKRLMSQATP